MFRLGGGYRFGKNSSVKFSWYKINKRGNKEMEKDFTWVNDEGEKFNIAAGSNLDSEQSYEIATVNYTWSFYNSGKVELFTSAGLLPIVNAMPDNTIILRHHGKN